eukprot:jgi/Galph1/1819/GphlegSOOS_G489.1
MNWKTLQGLSLLCVIVFVISTWVVVADESLDPKKPVETTTIQTNQTVPARSEWRRPPLNIVDAFYAGIALVYLIFFALGTWWNVRKSKNIGHWLQTYAQPQFAWIGPEKGKILYQDGIADYIFYASGRRNIAWLKCELLLKHRQDPFFFLRRPFENKWNISFNREIPPSVFCLTRARGARRFLSEHKDIEYYCESFTSFLVSLDIPCIKDFELFTENLELARKIMGEDSVKQVLKTQGKGLQRIYISERVSVKPTKTAFHAKNYIYIESVVPDDPKDLKDFVELACRLGDLLCSFQLSPGALQRSEKLRALVREDEEKEKEKKRREQILKEKQEKKQQSSTNVLGMSRSAQKKLEEKQKKAELKKKSKKGYQFVSL